MRITVKVKAGAKEERVEKVEDAPTLFDDGREASLRYVVSVKEPPVDGKANDAVCRALARHFGVPVGNVSIVSGHAYRQKVVDISQ